MAKKQEWVEGSVGLNKKELLIKQIAYNLILILVCIAVLYPVIWVVKMALTPNEVAGIGGDSANIQFTLDNFRHVIFKQNQAGDYLFFHQLWNSVIVSAITTVIGVLLACTAAYGFARLNFVGRQMGLQAFLVTQMFPGVVMMIPLYIILGKLGLTDNVLGLVLVYSVSALPFCVWNLKGYFDTIPKELEEAAIVDGASRARIFVTIVLPLARPAIAITALFSFMTAWNEFILAATFMNNEINYTLPVALKQYVGAQSVEYGYFAAGAILVSIPIMALFFALQKHLVGGLTAGSVKG
ncbi:MAG: sugar ABC transporter permease [Proteobacteria bacterium]|nr:sugar ABC transporter permease [Pseudomonadota bacterium]MBQ9241929.1 sugar ABC transporter permease [Pseudomonadota bacterium]